MISNQKLIILTAVLLLLTASVTLGEKYYFKKSAGGMDPSTTNNQEKKSILKNDSAENENSARQNGDQNGEYDKAQKKDERSYFDKVAEEAFVKSNEPIEEKKSFNVLILGIDRRTPNDAFYRTDSIQVISYNPNADKVLLVSIPRDLWVDGNKINAYYLLHGQKALKEKIKEITGLTISRVVRVDFDAVVWAIDAVGGVEVNIPRSFTDSSYPQDRDGLPGTKVISFKAGKQILDGEEALIFARSRKGTNGEGSDFARSYRQQLLISAAPKAFLKPESLFNPFVAKTAYNIITQKVYTDFSLSDVPVLYNIIKNHKKLKMEYLNVDYKFLYHPPMENYGGAWVIVPKDGTYEPIHNKINQLLET